MSHNGKMAATLHPSPCWSARCLCSHLSTLLAPSPRSRHFVHKGVNTCGWCCERALPPVVVLLWLTLESQCIYLQHLQLESCSRWAKEPVSCCVHQDAQPSAHASRLQVPLWVCACVWGRRCGFSWNHVETVRTTVFWVANAFNTLYSTYTRLHFSIRKWVMSGDQMFRFTQDSPDFEPCVLVDFNSPIVLFQFYASPDPGGFFYFINNTLHMVASHLIIQQCHPVETGGLWPTCMSIPRLS